MLLSSPASYITHFKCAGAFDDSFYLEVDDSANRAVLTIEDASSDFGERGLWCVWGVGSGWVPLRAAAHACRTAGWDGAYTFQSEKPSSAEGPTQWSALWPWPHLHLVLAGAIRHSVSTEMDWSYWITLLWHHRLLVFRIKFCAFDINIYSIIKCLTNLYGNIHQPVIF